MISQNNSLFQALCSLFEDPFKAELPYPFIVQPPPVDSAIEELILTIDKFYYTMAGIPVIVLEQDNEELGITCKKNFFVAVVGTI